PARDAALTVGQLDRALNGPPGGGVGGGRGGCSRRTDAGDATRLAGMRDTQLQSEIIAALEVIDPDTFDAAAEAERRIEFLARYLQDTGTKGLVLGISGGVDSTIGGRLCQLACERVRAAGGEAQFVAVRLPY